MHRAAFRHALSVAPAIVGYLTVGHLIVGLLPAQTDWTAADLFVPTNGGAACYDPVRRCMVHFGGDDGRAARDDTFEWRATGLTRQVLATRPPARSQHRLVYDRLRSRVVLFGGTSASGERNDTWVYDGAQWLPLSATGPAPRQAHAMTWDPVLGTVLLFGGLRNQILFQDTWTWDGVAWTPQNPALSPSPRCDAGCTTPLGGAPVLFGGRTAQGLTNDLYRWNGATWSSVATTVQPAAREQAICSADGSPNGFLLAAGRDTVGVRSDSWRFDGVQWTLLPQTNALAARAGAAATFDEAAAQILATGGIDGSHHRFGDLLTFQPQGSLQWTTLRASDSPPARQGHAASYDPVRARTVVFGGGTTAGGVLGDTWEWDGQIWQQRIAGPGPTARQYHALAFDSHRQRSLLFGGWNSSGSQADTWEWDGTGWNVLTPPLSPSPRQFHGMTEAPNGGVLLFGGSSALFAALGDTWLWNGVSWQALPVPGPTPRYYHAMACFAQNGEVVLFGGEATTPQNTTVVLGDTWVFDGAQWQQRQPTPSPPARSYATLAFAAERNRCVLHGGLDGNFQLLGDTWEWSGSDWQPVTVSHPPPARFHGCLVHHAASDETVLFGGSNLTADLPETVRYASATTATATSFGNGCPAPTGTPVLAAANFSRPWLGDTFAIVLSGLSAQPGLALIVYGFSDTNWYSVPLPAPLAGYGMPGCLLWVSADEPFFAPHGGHQVVFPFPLPPTPSYAGFAYYNQALVFDPTAGNTLGAVVSNAVRAQVGLR